MTTSSDKASMSDELPQILSDSIRNIYETAGMRLTSKPIREGGKKGEEYQAYRFSLDRYKIAFRLAKITSKKVGQFVTLWKPAPLNWIATAHQIIPLDMHNVDFVIIATSDDKNSGQFIFSQDVLKEHGIISTPEKLGKLSFRLYPPSSKPTTKQAIKIQQWQLPYFVPTQNWRGIDIKKVKRLFNH